MPTVTSAFRMLTAGLLTLAALSGCGDLESAAAAGGPRDDLAGDLSAQLAGAAGLTYTATYQLAGGGAATIASAQDPARSAYAYPGGKIILLPTETIRCAQPLKTMTCTVTAAPAPASPAPPGALTAAAKSGMVLPDTAEALLNAASLDTAKTVRQHDTTIAGHHATCGEMAGVNGADASTFTVCITNEGLLGSFTGTIAGTRVDAAMTRYAAETAPNAFEPPLNATMVDHRPK